MDTKRREFEDVVRREKIEELKATIEKIEAGSKDGEPLQLGIEDTGKLLRAEEKLKKLRAEDEAAGQGEDADVTPPELLSYNFRVTSVTLRRTDKVPGPQQYRSRESGFPFLTIEPLGWTASVEIEDRGTSLENLKMALSALGSEMDEIGWHLAKELTAEVIDEAKPKEVQITEL